MLHRLRWKHSPAVSTFAFLAFLIVFSVGVHFGILAAGIALLIVGFVAVLVSRTTESGLGAAAADPIAKATMEPAHVRYRRAALLLIGRHPVHAAAVVVVFVSLAGALHGRAGASELAETRETLQRIESERDAAVKARDENASRLASATSRADAANGELKSFASVIEPERARRKAAEEEEQKRNEEAAKVRAAEEARRTEEERVRKDEEAKARAAGEASAKRSDEIKALKDAISTGRAALDRAATKFEAVAFDHNPGSLTWVSELYSSAITAGLCADLKNSDIEAVCLGHFLDFVQATEELKDAYFDFFRGASPMGWVAQKDDKARSVLNEWSHEVERLK